MMFADRNPKFKQPLLYLFSLPCRDVSVDYFKINTTLMDMVKLLKELNGTVSYEDLLVLLKFIIYEYPIFCWDGINALIVYDKFLRYLVVQKERVMNNDPSPIFMP